MSEISDSVFVCASCVLDPQLVVVGECVDNFH
jgi:hypothetical protein